MRTGTVYSLLSNIPLPLYLTSYLRSKLVLDEEDCERILNTGTTRQQKASIFLDVIKRKGAEGMKHFMDALQFENPALYTRITGKQPTANEKGYYYYYYYYY